VSFRAEGEKSIWTRITDLIDFSLRSAPFEMTELDFLDALIDFQSKLAVHYNMLNTIFLGKKLLK
jgi:hypothetical protein